MGAALDWFENDALFVAQLAEGHRWARWTADQLQAAGLCVQVTPMQIRADIAERHKFSDEWDVSVGARSPCRVDVKSRNLVFTGREDYPFSTALVDTVSGWRAKTTPPHAIVLVSQ